MLIANEFLENWNYKNYFAAYFPNFTAKKLQQKAIQQQNINQFINKDFLHQNQNTNSLQKPVIKGLQDILNYNTHTFGLQDLLRYADRNSMAHSREVRLPFLNKDLVNFTAALPSSYKIKDGFTKWILRNSMQTHLPTDICWRKDKTGYEPPQQQWMQQPQLQEQIHEARKKLVKQQVLKQSVLNKPINVKPAHDANNYDWRYLSVAQTL